MANVHPMPLQANDGIHILGTPHFARPKSNFEVNDPPEVAFGDQVRHWLGVYQRRAAIFWALVVAVMAGFLFHAVQLVPRYTATATVVLDVRQEEVVDIEAVLSGVPRDSASIATEVGIIRSRELARRIALEQNLLADPEFNAALRTPTQWQQMQADARSAVSDFVRAATGDPRRDAAAAREAAAAGSETDAEDRVLEGVVNTVLGSLDVVNRRGAYLIDISFESESPRKAAQIANAYAEAYLTAQLEAKYDATRRANDWLSGRLTGLRAEVEAAEAAVENYRASEGLFTAQGASLVESRLSGIASELVLARSELAQKETRLGAVRQLVRDGGSVEAAGEILNAENIRTLRTEYAALTRERAELEGRLGARHPEMQRIQREIADLEAQIRAAETTVIANLEAEVRIASQRVSSLAASEAAAKRELSTSNSAEVRLRELERNAETVRTLYESFLSRFRETSEQTGLETSDAQIVSRASTPTSPSFPSKRSIMMQALVLAFALGIGVIVLLEMLENRFRTHEDVEHILGAPSLGSIPLLTPADLKVDGKKTTPEDYVLARPFSQYAEAFRALKASILLTNVDRTPKVVLFTSSLPGEGKTISSISFARSLALGGAKVLLLDADLRRRMLTERTKVKPKAGLLEVLTKTAELEDVIVTDPVSGVALLPLSNAKLPTVDVFGSQAFAQVLATLSDHYDVVVLDTAPVLAVSDTLTLAQSADAVVMIARWGKTTRTVVKRGLAELKRANAPLAGVLLTQVNQKQQAKYGYGYYKQYARYYHN